MKEAQPKQQLLEGCWLLAAVEEGWITDGIIQVALHQVGPQALHTHVKTAASEDATGLASCIAMYRCYIYHL